MARKGRSDSPDSQSKALQEVDNEIPVPDGVLLKSDMERTLWLQFTRARGRESWREFDLVLLSKVVRLEADIRTYQLTVDKSGPLIRNQRGTLVENPMLRVIDTLTRQQLAVIRSMSLTQMPGDARTHNSAGLEAERALDVVRSKGALSLLASPGD